MRKCLNSIHKALAEQNESFQDHAARTDAMHLMLGKALDGLRPASKTDSVVSGHLGAMTKLCRLHKEACDKAKELHTAVHAQLHKSAEAEPYRRKVVAIKEAMHKVIKEFESAVGGIIDVVSSSATEMEATAGG